MQTNIPIWSAPLNSKPDVKLMAVAAHGPGLAERYVSRGLWWLHLYTYTAKLRLNDVEMLIEPGCATLIPPGAVAEYDFWQHSVHACAHFTWHSNGEPLVSVPALRHLGDRFTGIYGIFEDAVGAYSGNAVRAEATVWSLLWLMTGSPARADVREYGRPDPVERARQIIELRLAQPLSVAGLAEEVGLSHNHLTRLFRKELGQTVVGYIRGRRLDRAKHLLEHTTLPIRRIGEQVGIEDSNFFSKTVRSVFGLTPSDIRRQGER